MKRHRDPYYYEEEEASDPHAREWHVWRWNEEDSIGMIRHERPDDYEVKTHRDNAFHSQGCTTRHQAADWLSEHEKDRSRFPREDDSEEDND
jgi:hypothetical protein